MRTNPFKYRNLSVVDTKKVMAWCNENEVEYDIWDFNFEDDDHKYVEIGLKDWSAYDQFTRRNP